MRFPFFPLKITLFYNAKMEMPVATLMQFWGNNLASQHFFGGEGMFKPNRCMVRTADCQDIAKVFQGLLAGTVGA